MRNKYTKSYGVHLKTKQKIISIFFTFQAQLYKMNKDRQNMKSMKQEI